MAFKNPNPIFKKPKNTKELTQAPSEAFNKTLQSLKPATPPKTAAKTPTPTPLNKLITPGQAAPAKYPERTYKTINFPKETDANRNITAERAGKKFTFTPEEYKVVMGKGGMQTPNIKSWEDWNTALDVLEGAEIAKLPAGIKNADQYGILQQLQAEREQAGFAELQPRIEEQRGADIVPFESKVGGAGTYAAFMGTGGVSTLGKIGASTAAGALAGSAVAPGPGTVAGAVVGAVGGVVANMAGGAWSAMKQIRAADVKDANKIAGESFKDMAELVRMANDPQISRNDLIDLYYLKRRVIDGVEVALADKNLAEARFMIDTGADELSKVEQWRLPVTPDGKSMADLEEERFLRALINPAGVPYVPGAIMPTGAGEVAA